MKLSVLLLGVSLVANLSHSAVARPPNFEGLAEQLPVVAPAAGLETAPIRAPSWCAAVKDKPGNDPSFIAMAIEDYRKEGWPKLIAAAQKTCPYANEPAVHKAAAVIEQLWINLTGLGDTDAVASIAARLDTASWDAARKELCASLLAEADDGEGGTYRSARSLVFGCSGDRAPQWQTTNAPPRELSAYLDQSATPPDAIVELSQVIHTAQLSDLQRNGYFDGHLVEYAIDRVDIDALTAAQLDAVLETAPYKGNVFAHVIAKESFARARLDIVDLDGEIAKKVKDPDWKELLIDAPKRAVDAYLAEAKPFAAEIARSNAFEHTLFGPSLKAMAGCLPELRRDFLKVWKRVPIRTEAEAIDALSRPVTALLVRRVVACMAVDSDPMIARMAHGILAKVRDERGVRTAAFYGAVEALVKIDADRTNFSLQPKDLMAPNNLRLENVADALLAKRKQSDPMGFVLDERGTVKSATRTAKGLVIVFEDKAAKVMDISCVDTNHILDIDSSGHVRYVQSCHNTGMITVHDQPVGLTIPLELADGIGRGSVIEYDVTRGDKTQRLGFPFKAYADAKKTKLVNFYGFPI